MPPTVVVGLDNSPESRTAAAWAAEEAVRRAAALRLVHAWVPRPYDYAPLAGVQSPLPPRNAPLEEEGPQKAENEPLLVGVRRQLEQRHPGLLVSAEEVAEQAVPALLDAAQDAEVLVLGSRRLGAVTGFLVGSVALGAVARTRRPVVLVGEWDDREGGEGGRTSRKTTQGGPAPPSADVVLGLDLRHPADPLIAFAFDAAARRSARLRVVYGWSPAPYARGEGAHGPGGGADWVHQELTGALHGWQQQFPSVEVDEQAVAGKPAAHLVEASHDAALLVVGRRSRRSRVGGHIGPVTHMVLHHTHAPVVVVPHD